ncbi:hypothetical protein NDU88_008311 [Pleurodeles waltl]|uniref:Uncharacterized protein n=1 Tax=Pleurodeles waltl TaxID=8319 RepID=A0AAV7NLE2_PLEWA|nr:hypothetical protein NDU88_005046 [Pleurodeles waltl]KAJ1116842.1 hypothetical protein NDU88_005047 [Pleurodeles waltl]KAJ1123388.1 hypothetical protein NDU88_001858 [Pleurodeles waltl]KAJ1155582.1 hypothetical protein NDU88_008311 [Pleurodeles waltl]
MLPLIKRATNVCQAESRGGNRDSELRSGERRSTYLVQVLWPGGNLPRSVVPEDWRNPGRDAKVRTPPEAED